MTSIGTGTIEELLETVDIPESAHESAQRRYHDVADWFSRPEARCWKYVPHVYPQGSFRLGTVVRPVSDAGEYDLDLGCRLRSGPTKFTFTQRALKELIGADLADYRVARRILDKPEEMHRCWRLRYADKLSFHLDAVPSIPEAVDRRRSIRGAMMQAGVADSLATRISELTGVITDNRLPNYNIIDPGWRISNSEGYALWFESRMRLAEGTLRERAFEAHVAKIDDLPAYRWKSPLQAAIQLLKRHRDVLFEKERDRAPISIIITTLAAQAYQGESSPSDSLATILASMDRYIRPSMPRIPNPVNPAEDFADKWYHPQCIHLGLEASFRRWLSQARTDFERIVGANSVTSAVDDTRRIFAAAIDPAKVGVRVDRAASRSLLAPAVTTGTLSFPPKALVPSKPAGFA
jgi:hypothetical protein